MGTGEPGKTEKREQGKRGTRGLGKRGNLKRDEQGAKEPGNEGTRKETWGQQGNQEQRFWGLLKYTLNPEYIRQPYFPANKADILRSMFIQVIHMDTCGR